MSYCRWSCVVPELSPDVDFSIEKLMGLYKDGGYGTYKNYLNDSGAVFSEAYVYESIYGGFVCHWIGKEDDYTETAGEMAEILIAAVKKGKRVPQSAIDALLEEELESSVYIGDIDE